MVALWDYEGLAKELVQKAKYVSLIDIPREMVEYGFFVVKENEPRFSEFLSFLFKEETVLAFVPLHKRKQKKRGFNQAEVIARHISQFTNKKTLPLLKAKKKTRSQTKLSREERIKNVKNAFAYNPKIKKPPQAERFLRGMQSLTSFRRATRSGPEHGRRRYT